MASRSSGRPERHAAWTAHVHGWNASEIIGAAGKFVRRIIVSNAGASDRWIGINDSASYPASTETPNVGPLIVIEAGKAVEIQLNRVFAADLSWSVSSTATTVTEDNAATFAVAAEYEP